MDINFFPNNRFEDLSVSIAKNTAEKLNQTERKAKEALDLKIQPAWITISFNPSLRSEGGWLISVENLAEFKWEINKATESNTLKSYVSEDKVDAMKLNKSSLLDEYGVDTLIFLGVKVIENFRQFLIRKLKKKTN